jgi:hypothetical protein
MSYRYCKDDTYHQKAKSSLSTFKAMMNDFKEWPGVPGLYSGNCPHCDASLAFQIKDVKNG